jgi:hypothetical protein
MDFDDFMKAAWNDHADKADEVAARLAASLQVVETASQIPRFAGLVTHVYGEHLGQWKRGVAVHEALRASPAFDGSPEARGAIDRGIAALNYCAGDASSLPPLTVDDRVAVLAVASSAMLGRHDHDAALAAFDEALHGAQAGLPAGSPALRALAIGGNNLAAALEEKPDRDAAQTAGMLRAAEAGVTYWTLAGGWLEQERAEYRLTRSLLQAGQPAAAAAAARRCLDVCAANDAPDFERFFGHAVLALALRAAGDTAGYDASRQQALACYATVPMDEQKWCAGELRELGA